MHNDRFENFNGQRYILFAVSTQAIKLSVRSGKE
jgi:hypothetical protein